MRFFNLIKQTLRLTEKYKTKHKKLTNRKKRLKLSQENKNKIK